MNENTNLIDEHNEGLTPIEQLSPFKRMVLSLGTLPSAFYNTMTYYESLVYFYEYLKNEVIPTVNNNGEAVEELQTKYIELKDYVDNYFENLDVQEEINQKLDEMTEDGTLTNLIKDYVDPLYQAYEQEINETISLQNTTISTRLGSQDTEITNFKNSVNSQLSTIDNKVESATSGSPAGIYATVSALTTADPDHDKIYLVENDGKWYYYDTNTTTWVAGGTYQSTGLSDANPVIANLRSEVRENAEGIVHVKNLVPEIIQGHFSYTGNGVGGSIIINDNASYCYMKIPVHYGLYYSCSLEPGSDSFCAVCDSNDKIIGVLSTYRVGNTGWIYQMPQDAKWLYISHTAVTDYVVLNTNESIIGYSTNKYPINTLVEIDIPLLNNEKINSAYTTLYDYTPTQHLGYIDRSGNINAGGSGNHYAIIEGITKGDKIIYSGKYNAGWGLVYGYTIDNIPTALLTSADGEDYTDLEIIINDESIVKVAGWSADAQKELKFKKVGLKTIVESIDYSSDRIIYVGQNEKFTDIQSAINYANSIYNTLITPVTIVVKNGIYNVTPSTTSPYYAIDKGSNRISIIGEDRDHTIINCTCTDERQGIALNIGGSCTIANLTINNLADDSYTEQTILEGNHRPYCIHNDTYFASETSYYTTIKNCKLYSECDTPIGAGLQDKQVQRYENIETIYNSNIDKKHGSIYVHSPASQSATPVGLEFIDCVVTSLNQMPTLCLWNVTSAGTFIADTPMTFVRNVTATNGSQELSISAYNKTIACKLNSANNLNY